MKPYTVLSYGLDSGQAKRTLTHVKMLFKVISAKLVIGVTHVFVVFVLMAAWLQKPLISAVSLLAK